jgi:hypothetical protein
MKNFKFNLTNLILSAVIYIGLIIVVIALPDLVRQIEEKAPIKIIGGDETIGFSHESTVMSIVILSCYCLPYIISFLIFTIFSHKKAKAGASQHGLNLFEIYFGVFLIIFAGVIAIAGNLLLGALLIPAFLLFISGLINTKDVAVVKKEKPADVAAPAAAAPAAAPVSKKQAKVEAAAAPAPAAAAPAAAPAPKKTKKSG